MESELSLDLLLLLNGAVVSGLWAQLSLSAVFSDFRDGAIDDFAPLLDFGFSGSLNSALYLSGGIDFLLYLPLVVSVIVLPSNGLASSSSSLDSAVWSIWGGGVYFHRNFPALTDYRRFHYIFSWFWSSVKFIY